MRSKALRAAIRIVLVVLAVAIVFSCVYEAFAAGLDEDKITPNAVMLVDITTGRELYAKNAEAKIAPASTTKILTAVVILEKADPEDEVTVGGEVENLKGTMMGLAKGDKVTIESLLYGMFLNSGNDAAAAAAVHVGGSLDGFAKLMNQKAAEIGMDSSHFVTVSGLDNEDHYVTVHDMAKLVIYACKQDYFSTVLNIAKQKKATIKSVNGKKKYSLKNTNRLIYSGDEIGDPASYMYEYATGLKTGSTPNAKKCLVALAEKDGQKLAALVYGDESDEGKKRWPVAQLLFDYGFDNYENVALSSLFNESELKIDVPGAARSETLDGTVLCTTADGEEAPVLTVERGTANDITFKITAADNLNAPVAKGDKVGTMEFYNGEKLIYSCDAVAAEKIMSQQEYDDQLVKEIEPVELEEKEQKELPKELLLLWLIIPVGLIAFLIVRAVMVKNKRKRRFSRPNRGGQKTAYKVRRRRRL